MPDRQTGQPSFVLGGQYPITDYYVKSESAAAQEGRVHKGGAFDVQLRHEGTNIKGERVVNHPKTQLNDALIESYQAIDVAGDLAKRGL